MTYHIINNTSGTQTLGVRYIVNKSMLQISSCSFWIFWLSFYQLQLDSSLLLLCSEFIPRRVVTIVIRCFLIVHSAFIISIIFQLVFFGPDFFFILSLLWRISNKQKQNMNPTIYVHHTFTVINSWPILPSSAVAFGN